MTSVNREMLTLAREARRMSQTELAEAAGLVPSTVSRAEHEQYDVSDETVAAYAKHLRYPIELFYDRAPAARLPVTFYRKKKKVDPMHLKAIDARMRFMLMHFEKLLRSVAAPPLRIQTVDLNKHRGSPSDVANDLRLAWNVKRGPIANMTALIEAAGCFVVRWNFDVPDVDALSVHYDGLPPMIVVEASLPGDRLRFTLAHELAHLIFHHHQLFPGDNYEEEADEFAAAFLMPSDEIRPFLHGLTIEKLAHLKSHWRTSMASILVRAGDLGAISESQSTRLWKMMRHLRFTREEPVKVDAEMPSLTSKLVSFHMKKFDYSAAQMSKLLPLEEDEFKRTYLNDASPRGGLRVVK